MDWLNKVFGLCSVQISHVGKPVDMISTIDSQLNGDTTYRSIDLQFQHEQNNSTIDLSSSRFSQNEGPTESGVYDGEFLKGMRHGYGKLTLPDGTTYSGDWVAGEKHGKGTLKSRDFEYRGDFAHNLYHGSGVLAESNGCTYIGEFVHGKKHGYGSQNFSKSKKQYTGNFYNNEINGKGYLKWSDGRSYKGNFEGGQFNGIGVFTWPDGKLYHGEFLNGKQHGQGVFVNPLGVYFMGNSVDGVVVDWRKMLRTEIDEYLEKEKYESDRLLEMNGMSLEERHVVAMENLQKHSVVFASRQSTKPDDDGVSSAGGSHRGTPAKTSGGGAFGLRRAGSTKPQDSGGFKRLSAGRGSFGSERSGSELEFGANMN